MRWQLTNTLFETRGKYEFVRGRIARRQRGANIRQWTNTRPEAWDKYPLHWTNTLFRLQSFPPASKKLYGVGEAMVDSHTH